MRPPLSYLPALPAAVGWMVGILLWWWNMSWWCAAAATVVGIGLMLCRVHYFAFVFYAIAAGWTVAEDGRPVEAPAWIFDGKERLVSGCVENVFFSPRSQTMVVRVDSVSGYEVESFNMQAISLPQWMPPTKGTRLWLCAEIERLDHGGHFPFQADYSTLFLRRGVVAGAYVEEDNIRCVGCELSVSSWFSQRRRDIVSALAHTGLTDNAYGLLAALIVGHGDDLSPDVREDFRATGLAYALALSGFHVGMIVMLAGVLLFPLRVWPRFAPWRMLVALIFLWFYAAMVGMSESVVRAAVMLTVFMVGRVVGRGVSPYNSLCVAVLVLLALWPYSLFSVGFQLSVCAVLGILAFARPLNPFSPKDGWKFRTVEIVVLPVAAVLGTMVVTVTCFHRFPLAFIISNVVVVGLLPLLMWGGVALVAFGSCPWLEWCLNGITDFITSFTSWLASTGNVEMSGVYVSAVQVAALALVIFALAFAVNLHKRIAWLAFGLCVAAACVIMPFGAEADPIDETFKVGNRTNAPILVRHGSKVELIPQGRKHLHRQSVERALRELSVYFEARGIDTVTVVQR